MGFLIDTTKLQSNNKTYGGNAGYKKGVLLNNENYIVKFPQDLSNMSRVTLKFSTSPLSEYLGSKIYKILGFDVQDVKMGIGYNNKETINQVVVLCKDITENNKYEIVDYEKIKNFHNYQLQEASIQLNESLEKSSDALFMSHHTNLRKVILDFEKNDLLKNNDEIKKHFWNLLIVDFLINNNDRNKTNWGLLRDKNTGKYKLCPVFDNGAAFTTKHNDEKLNKIMNSEHDFEIAAGNGMSHFVLTPHNTNFPTLFKQMEQMNLDKDFKQAVLFVVPIIKSKIKEIYDFIDNIPEKENNYTIITPTQKKYYKKQIKYCYEKHLLPLFEKYKSKDNVKIM